jgi:large subunit ribosomal protein L15
MQVHLVRPTRSRPNRKRIGRGNAAGQGTYAGKGLKGQNARSGGGVRPGFEGGQNPQIKGLPKLRGFTNIFRTEYQIVDLRRLNRLPADVTEVTPQLLERHGLIRNARKLVKVLGQGEVARPLRVQASKFSQSARAKIEAAGGGVVEA